MSATDTTKVWIAGEVAEAADAKLSVLDHGLLYGDGVFEGIRVCDGRLFRLDAHLCRFAASARAIGLELPRRDAALAEIPVAAARAYGAREAYLRLVATRGTGPLGVDPTACRDPQLFCIAGPMALYPAERVRRGLDLVTVSVRRDPAAAVDPRVKSLNYLGSALAKREASLRGADEALLLNPAGAVAEAAVANVFVLRDGVLLTPPASDGALEGITRATILELATELGLPTRVDTLGRMDLFRAEATFLCGTGAGLVAVRSLDAQSVSQAPDLIVRLRDAYRLRAGWDGVAVA